MISSEIKAIHDECINIEAFKPGYYMDLDNLAYEPYLDKSFSSFIEYDMNIILKLTNQYLTEAVDKSLSLYHYHCKVTESLGKM